MKTAIVSLIMALAGTAAALPQPSVPPVLNLTTRGLLSRNLSDTGTTAVAGNGGNEEAAAALEGRDAAAAAEPPKPAPTNECIPVGSILYDKYTVHGVHFDFLGDHGSRLEKELRGCAGFGDFVFERKGPYGYKQQYSWESTFRHTLFQRNCVGHALQTLGGQMISCHS